MRQQVFRSFIDDSGQDLIEYGLLASIIAIAGILLFPSIKSGMNTAFGNWGTAVYNLWAPAPPAGT
jgi:Flp pilus assembly pilin Flp